MNLNYQCCVCFENINNEIKAVLPCQHDLCKNCLNHIKHHNDGKAKCPLCRADIPENIYEPLRFSLNSREDIRKLAHLDFYNEYVKKWLQAGDVFKNYEYIFYDRNYSSITMFHNFQDQNQIKLLQRKKLCFKLDLKIYKSYNEDQKRSEFNREFQKDIRFIAQLDAVDKGKYNLKDFYEKRNGRIQRCSHCKELGHSRSKCRSYKHFKSQPI